jgi:hypothetical protein
MGIPVATNPVDIVILTGNPKDIRGVLMNILGLEDPAKRANK